MTRTHETQRLMLETVIDAQRKTGEDGPMYGISIAFSDDTPNLDIPFGYEFDLSYEHFATATDGIKTVAFDITHISVVLMT